MGNQEISIFIKWSEKRVTPPFNNWGFIFSTINNVLHCTIIFNLTIRIIYIHNHRVIYIYIIIYIFDVLKNKVTPDFTSYDYSLFSNVKVSSKDTISKWLKKWNEKKIGGIKIPYLRSFFKKVYKERIVLKQRRKWYSTDE